jgi:uncharacterized Fe-S center protein
MSASTVYFTDMRCKVGKSLLVKLARIADGIRGDREHTHRDHFTDIHPNTDWKSRISHVEKIGPGSGEYELVTV